MKQLNPFFAFFFFVVLVSCASQMKMLSSGKQIDPKLVGIWTGSEVGQQIEGIEKSWEMTRSEDGTFILNFQFNENGKVQNIVETGNWWIEKGKFHEFHSRSGKTDIYKYKVLNKNQIRFVSKTIGVAMNSEEYKFIDTRKSSKVEKGLSL